MTRAPRSVRSMLAGTTLLLTTVGGASGAWAAPRQSLEYDALGDSYAAGVGVAPYNSYCGRTDAAYAIQVDGREKIHLDQLVACGGATTASLVSQGQLDVLSDSTGLVTISIGGNDIGWGKVVGACLVLDDPGCLQAVAATRQFVTGVLPGRLETLYAQIKADAPNAQVVVTGYPRLFSPEFGPYVVPSPSLPGQNFEASVAEQQALNDGADLLNAVIAKAAGDFGFRFVDVTKRFVGHGVNAPVPWVNGALSPAAFHPNAAGYQAYTAAVTAAVDPSRGGV